MPGGPNPLRGWTCARSRSSNGPEPWAPNPGSDFLTPRNKSGARTVRPFSPANPGSADIALSGKAAGTTRTIRAPERADDGRGLTPVTRVAGVRPLTDFVKRLLTD